MSGAAAFQDLLPDNSCFGCGPNNVNGLRIKSHWADAPGGTAVCTFTAAPHHNAGSANILNGGIIATIMDCHSVITAVAQAYADAGREFATGDLLWYVTGRFELNYRAPALLAEPVMLTARVVESDERKSRVSCELTSAGNVCTTSEMVAVRVAMEWHDV